MNQSRFLEWLLTPRPRLARGSIADESAKVVNLAHTTFFDFYLHAVLDSFKKISQCLE